MGTLVRCLRARRPRVGCALVTPSLYECGNSALAKSNGVWAQTQAVGIAEDQGPARNRASRVVIN